MSWTISSEVWPYLTLDLAPRLLLEWLTQSRWARCSPAHAIKLTAPSVRADRGRQVRRPTSLPPPRAGTRSRRAAPQPEATAIPASTDRRHEPDASSCCRPPALDSLERLRPRIGRLCCLSHTRRHTATLRLQRLHRRGGRGSAEPRPARRPARASRCTASRRPGRRRRVPCPSAEYSSAVGSTSGSLDPDLLRPDGERRAGPGDRRGRLAADEVRRYPRAGDKDAVAGDWWGEPRRPSPTCSTRPRVEHRKSIAQRQRLVLVVRHEDKRDADIALNRLEFQLHLLAQLEVESTERFVQ